MCVVGSEEGEDKVQRDMHGSRGVYLSKAGGRNRYVQLIASPCYRECVISLVPCCKY